MNNIQELEISKLVLDSEIQPRASLDMIVIQEYAESMRDGDQFPAIEAVFDGGRYWVWDGFHRVNAAQSAGINLPVNVTDGTREDAKWLALGANTKHGLRRSNADKRRAVEMALKHPNGASKSDNQIAQHCGVHHSTVGTIRKQLESTCEIRKSNIRTGADGRAINTANIGQGPQNNSHTEYTPNWLSSVNGHATYESTQPTFIDTDIESNEGWPICQECGQVFDGASCPDCGEGDDYERKPNYLRDNRRARPQDIYTPLVMDACQTPPYAIGPLLPYLPQYIWEPAQGEGYLVGAFYDAGKSVIGSDILEGSNFFEYEPEETWDAIITNPPYSIYRQWLERCYGLGKPFALLLKVDMLGNKGTQELIQKYDFEMMLLDQRVDFKMPNKGWDSNATFPTFWLCWKLLPEQVMFGKLDKKDMNGV